MYLIDRFKDRLGPAGVAIGVAALVLALVTGAYAAGGGLSGKQRKEVEKIAKKLAKSGPIGPQGSKGDPGAAGAPGKDGTNGTDGTSVTAETFSGSLHGCTAGAGGVSLKSASPEVAVCNGKNGTNGTTGFTETLPPEKTETGSWIVGPYPKLESYPGKNTGVRIPVSFPIPLAGEPTPHLILSSGEEFTASFEEVTSTACTGSVTTPTAEPGNFCLYAQTASLVSVSNPTGTLFLNPASGFVNPETAAGGVSKAGVLLEAFTKETNGAEAFGTWAVTAE
jgi:hypothetical protein